MSDKIAKPVDGSYGTTDGVETTEDMIARLVKNAEAGFPSAKFRSPGTDGGVHACGDRSPERVGA